MNEASRKVLRYILRLTVFTAGVYSIFVLGILLFGHYVEGAFFTLQALSLDVMIPALLPSLIVAILGLIYFGFTSQKRFTKILLIMMAVVLIVGGKWFYGSRYNAPLREKEQQTTVTVGFTREAVEGDVLEAVERIEDIDGIKSVKYFSKEDLWESNKARLSRLPGSEEFVTQYMPDGGLPIGPKAEIRTKEREITSIVANIIKDMFSSDLVGNVTYYEYKEGRGWRILTPE